MGLIESRWLKKDANSFVTTNKTELEVKLNATGALEKTVDGINIKALGIVDAMLAGSISTAKLAEGTEFIKRDGSVAMIGALTLSGAPTADLHAATKAYVDASIQGGGGGSITAGNGLTQTGNTIDVVAGSGIAVAADSVSLGPLTTDWDIGGTKTITNVKDPVNATDVSNKQWIIANSTKNVTDKFTYDGTNASFTLSAVPSDLNKVVVIVSGAPGLSSPSDYSVSVSGGVGTLTLDSSVTSAMITGDVITVMCACVVS
jgi:hypothetical protein